MTEIAVKYLMTATITASITAAVVIAARLILKRAPKKWAYFMWAVVFFRCLCPISVECGFSVFNAFSCLNASNIILSEEVAEGTLTDTDHIYVQGNDVSEDVTTTNTYPSAPAESDNIPSAARRSISVYDIIFAVWLCGIIVISVSSIIPYIRISESMRTAIKQSENIYESDRISTAFTLGIFRPKIYLPCGIPDKEKEFIITHEQYHISRKDNIIKPIFFLGLILHWFNPMIWVSFILMTRDMEMSCDEAVINKLGEEKKREYSETLLHISAKGSGIALPVGFGETGIKERMKNALRFKKPKIGITVVSIAVMLTACAVTGTNAARSNAENEQSADADVISVAVDEAADLNKQIKDSQNDEERRQQEIQLKEKALQEASASADETEEPDIHTNSKGQTYGTPHIPAGGYSQEEMKALIPDLIRAYGKNGTVGYILSDDYLPPDDKWFDKYTCGWEILDKGEGGKHRVKGINVPMYDSEGEPIDDFFLMGSTEDCLYIDSTEMRSSFINDIDKGLYPSLICPVPENVKITDKFKPDGAFHSGIDYSVQEGTTVSAAAGGTVIQSGDYENGYGNCIVIEHSNGMTTVYAHLSEAIVSKNSQVKAGDTIGLSGHSGQTVHDNLHFEVRINNKYADPEIFF